MAPRSPDPRSHTANPDDGCVHAVDSPSDGHRLANELAQPRQMSARLSARRSVGVRRNQSNHGRAWSRMFPDLRAKSDAKLCGFCSQSFARKQTFHSSSRVSCYSRCSFYFRGGFIFFSVGRGRNPTSTFANFLKVFSFPHSRRLQRHGCE